MQQKVGLLLSGLALRQRVDRHGRRQGLDLALPGDVIGFETAMLGANLTEVRAVSSVLLAVAPVDVFNRSLATAAFSASIMQAIAQQHRRLENRIVRLGQLNAQGRIAALLIDTIRRLGADPSRPLHLPLTQRDIAALVGLTSIHVSRVLHGFAEQQILTFRRFTLQIADPDALVRIACLNGTVDAAALGI